MLARCAIKVLPYSFSFGGIERSERWFAVIVDFNRLSHEAVGSLQ
jgi:hypothetical protein